jgi:hypothetical protein
MLSPPANGTSRYLAKIKPHRSAPLDIATKHKAIECLDMMSRRMDEMEANREARWDAEDRELEEDLREGNTMPVAPSAPFADSRQRRFMASPTKNFGHPNLECQFRLKLSEAHLD